MLLVYNSYAITSYDDSSRLFCCALFCSEISIVRLSVTLGLSTGDSDLGGLGISSGFTTFFGFAKRWKGGTCPKYPNTYDEP